ncbi:PAS domain S-box protein [Thiocystis violacea]|uniref:PAS domain S-box protein n=1 Tax=Thiocystis violacea TaxID=13725 RepID=UPI001F5B4621|nr:PAS domain S-box protein [Thiocystis violacea]MBK1721634.1 histidine kinase [Thiocystis violacea]
MTEPLRLLLLEDNPLDAELTEHVLRKAGLSFTSQRVQDREAFLAALEAFRPDLVLADYQLPRFDGRQALRLVRERDRLLPFIFVTGALGDESAVELLRAGADDYILKDSLVRLCSAIGQALGARRRQAALEAAERALKESESRFRALVETTLDWIWEVDAEGRYTYVSPVSLGLLGYAPEEMLGRTPWAFMAPEEGERVEQAFKAILAERAPFAMLENRCLRKDGDALMLETSGTPIFAADGALRGYRGIDRDVTQRRRNAAALLLQTRRASALLELPRAAERMGEAELMQCGLELAEDLTESRIAFIHFVNDDQETIELVTWSRRTLDSDCHAAHDRHYPVSQAGIWADALRRGEPVVFNDYPATPHKAGLPEGHAALDRLISVPVIDGDLVRMLASVGNKAADYDETDVETLQLIANEIWRIVRQRRADRALRESECRFHALFENMRGGVCILDALDDGEDFRFRDVNLAVERIESIPRAEIRGRRLTEVFPGVADFGLIEVLRRVWRTGVPEHFAPTFYSDASRAGWRENFVYRLPDGELVTVYEDVTERKELELALEESRERLSLALDGSDLGMWDWQVPNGSVQVNARWAEMLGYCLEELQPVTYATWERLCHPRDLVLAKQALERHFAGETPYYEIEMRLRHKDGGYVWVLDRGRVVERDAYGHPLRATGTHLDVSVRKRSEEQLRQLSLAVDQSPASIVITDLEGCIQYVNPAFTQVSGYSREEAVGQNPRLLSSGRTPAAVHAQLWETLARGEVWRGEFCNRRKDGGEYVELAIISPVRQPDGQVTHYLAVKEDITEKKRVEQELEHYRLNLEELVETRTAELRLAEERSRLILESSADGLFGEDTGGRATFINPAACAMLGYAPEQVLGRSMHELIHHSRADGSAFVRSECPIHHALGDHRAFRQDEDVFWRADGTAFPVTYSSHPMYRDGQVVGSVVSFFDISAKKQAEAAREAALVEAERLARLKSEFLANMSHEIRTPLNAVLGFAQAGERHSQGRKGRDFFKRILESGQLLLGIVDDILDFSKIEAGKLAIDAGEVDLRGLIERTTDLFATRIEEQGLGFCVEESPDLPASFRGDDLRLAQVLGNLLSNAIKFTARGEVRLLAGRQDETLVFSVLDTGIGMSEAQIANLFSPFEQADGSITRRFGGTGLGLAISKRLAEMMGGDLQVRSQLGKGTRFDLRVPLIDPRGVIGPHRIAPRTTVLAQTRQRLRGLVILVAEDNPANRLVLEELLDDEGCALVQVENGLEAVERVRNDAPGAFDLVLMDIQMPVMDGLEATGRIRELAPALPVIGLTAHAMRSERERCLAAGMLDHVAKPVDLEILIATILKRVARQPQPQPQREADSLVRPGVDRSSAEAVDEAFTTGAEGVDAWVDWPLLESRYAHNPSFLPRLLGAVLDSGAGQAAALRQAADRENFDQVAFIAHRLKGTAGNLFASGLSLLAVRAETEARERRIGIARIAGTLADALDATMSEIRASRWIAVAAPAGEAAWPEQAADGVSLSEAVDRLQALLEMDDTAANDAYERDQGVLLQSFGADAERLGAEIKGFEYQAALETLRALMVVRMRT